MSLIEISGFPNQHNSMDQIYQKNHKRSNHLHNEVSLKYFKLKVNSPVRVRFTSEHGYQGHVSVLLWKPAWSSKIYLWGYQHRESHHHQMSANNHMSWCHGLQCILLLWRQNCPHRILSGQVWPIKVIYELSQNMRPRSLSFWMVKRIGFRWVIFR